MKLVSLNIINFGKLHNVNLNFDCNLNVICRQNGWGKSTVAAFIKVMFYGFDGENKRDDLNCERKRYFPWQGGNYGGSLTFSVGENTYTVTRMFGDKASMDEFELRDASTNLISDDYSSKIGEELFKINSESFIRTSFIGQNDCLFDGTTGDINSKLGNIEDLIDLNRFQSANEAIKDKLNEMSPARKTGEIHRLKSRLAELKAQADALEIIPARMTETQDTISRMSGEIENLEDKINLVHKERIAKADRINRIKLINNYKMLLNDLNDKNEGYSVLTESRDNPSNALYKDVNDEELDEMITLSKHLDMINEEACKLSLNDSERDEYVLLGKHFDKFTNPVEITKYYTELNHKNDDLKQEILSLQVQKESYDNKNSYAARSAKKAGLTMLLGLVILIFGVLVSFSTKVAAPVVGFKTYYMLLAAGITCDVVAIIVIIAAAFKFIDLYVDKAAYEVSIADNAVNISSYEEEISENYSEIIEFLAETDFKSDELSVTEQLEAVLYKAHKFENLRKKESDSEAIYLLNDYDSKYDLVSAYVLEHKITVKDSVTMALTEFRYSLREYKSVVDKCCQYEMQINDAKERLLRFMQDNPGIETDEMLSEENEAQDDSMSDTAEFELKQQYEDLVKKRENERRNLSLLVEQYERFKELKEEIAETETTVEDKMTEYNILSKTQTFLIKAKENLTSRYMDPLLSGFKKYYGTIKGSEADEYTIDANLNITRVSEGKQRDIKLLSNGYQNLIGLCMRLAMIDAMYPGEKPVLVFDDPFVNMDDETMERARGLLDSIGNIYQVIYISCSNLRI